MNTAAFKAIDKYAGKPTNPAGWRIYRVESPGGVYRGRFIVHPEWNETESSAFQDWKELYKIGTSWSGAELAAMIPVFEGFGVE